MKVNYLIKAFFAVSLVLAGVSCTKPEPEVPDWPWVDPAPGEDPGEDPGDEPGPEPPAPVESKPRYVWIDASANFYYYANSEKQIADDLRKIKATGFTDVIVDVRPTEGTVLFKSGKAPQAKRLAAWINGQYKFVNRTADFDYLQAFIDAGHEVGLRVNAAMNTFVCGYGGYYGLASEGPIFSGDIPKEWATVINAKDGLQSTFYEGVEGTVFMNPANEEVQKYMIDLIGELAGYNLDGILLDRCRFDDNELLSDFSDQTRKAFETYLGKSLSKWPSDVFAPGTEILPRTLSATQKAWMSFRAKTIHDFVEKASQKVHSVNPKIRFGCYVGAWFDSYYGSGVNWASPDYNVKKSYNWVDAEYQKYGYADHCDFMMLGCYAGTSSVYGNGEWTMQGFAKLGKQKIGAQTEVSGGPDVGNSTGFEKGGQHDVIPKTIDACINACDGYFVFDLCHIRMYEYWNDFKKGFDDYLNSLNQ